MTRLVTTPRAVVFGAEGTLGRALVAHLPEAQVAVAGAFGRAECNILDASAVRERLQALRPDVVFNAAAYNHVDRAESEPEVAFAVNAKGPELLARACREVGAKIVHYSTDFVFDGELDRPYREDDEARPLGAYGSSKLEGERLLRAATGDAFVLRVACLYGDGGKNFPSTILRRLAAGETVRADADRVVSPCWVVPLARASAAVARTQKYGLYHCTAAGQTTWAGFACFIAAALRIPAGRVDAVATGALPLAARRPRYSILDSRGLRGLGIESLGDWQSHARAYLAAEEARPTRVLD